MWSEIQENILSAVGRTPLVQIQQYLPDSRIRLFAKLEMFNPGGSIKDRPATEILLTALRTGKLRRGSVVVESSSGNMGIGLAQACRYHGLRFICVVDPKAAKQNLLLLRAYGAEIDFVAEPDPETGEFLQARIRRVQQLVEQTGAWWPNQYANLANPRTHYRTTMHEIATALEGRIDYLFAATSTCGTIRGCAEYARDYGLGTKMIAVDAYGSLIFSDIKAPRKIPGLGAGFRPPLCETGLIDKCVHVTDLDCVIGCRRLVARESILAGGSSGGVLLAIEEMAPSLPDGSVCVAILPDRGERYLDTVYSDDWVRRHFGEVDHLWESGALQLQPVAVARG